MFKCASFIFMPCRHVSFLKIKESYTASSYRCYDPISLHLVGRLVEVHSSPSNEEVWNWWRGLWNKGEDFRYALAGTGWHLLQEMHLDVKQKPVLKLFLTFSLLLLPQVVKRGMAPGGGGEVVFTCPVRKTIKPVQLTEPGKIKRIRGVAYPSQAYFTYLLFIIYE